MKKKSRIYGIINILIAMALLAVFLLKITGFYYAINDDISMHNLAAGTVTGMPDGHLIFVKYVLGKVIAKMFKLFPQFDWYGLTLIGTMFICYFLILIRMSFVSRNKKSNLWKWVFGLSMLCVLFVNSTVLFQFTTVAGVTGATAVFYLASAKDRFRISDYVIACILLIVTSLIRLKVFSMMLPLCIVIVVITILKNIRKEEGKLRSVQFGALVKRHRKKLLAFAIVTLCTILAYGGMIFIEKKAYSEEPWKTYTEYKHARSLIMDYYGWPPYEGHEEFWDSIDVSQEEYKCLSMYGILPDIDTDKMVKIADYSEKVYKESMSVKHSVKGMAALLIQAATAKSCLLQNILLVLMFLLLIIFFIQTNRFNRWCIIAGVVVQLGILLYILYQGRFPSRIIMAYDFECIMAIFGVLFSGWISGGKAVRYILRTAGGVACVGMLFFTMTQTQSIVRNSRSKLASYNEKIAYVDSMPDRVFVVTPSSILTAKQFTVKENIASRNTISTAGWSVLSPWYEKKYADLGLDRNKHILLYPDVYLLTSNLSDADMINDYYHQEGLMDEDYQILDIKSFTDYSQLCVIKWKSIYPDPLWKEKLFRQQREIRNEQTAALREQENTNTLTPDEPVLQEEQSELILQDVEEQQIP